MKHFELFLNNDTAMIRATVHTVKAFIVGMTMLVICGFLFSPIKTFINGYDFTGQTINPGGLLSMINLGLNSWYIVLVFIPLSAIFYLFLRAYFIVEVSKPQMNNNTIGSDEDGTWR
jgi:hypothetical protein